MLDWAKEEKLFSDSLPNGLPYTTPPWETDATIPGPNAAAMLTALQKKIVDSFLGQKGNAEIIGMHAPQ